MWASAFSSQPLQPSAWVRSLFSSTVTDFRGYPLRVDVHPQRHGRAGPVP